MISMPEIIQTVMGEIILLFFQIRFIRIVGGTIFIRTQQPVGNLSDSLIDKPDGTINPFSGPVMNFVYNF